MEAERADLERWEVVVNSFEEVESEDIPALESFYFNGAKAWCGGPLLLCDEVEDEEEEGAGKPKNNKKKKNRSLIHTWSGWRNKKGGVQCFMCRSGHKHG